MNDQTVWCLTGELRPDDADMFALHAEKQADMRGEIPPTVSQFEIPGSDMWRVEAYFVGKPNADHLRALLHACDIDEWDYALDPVEEKDWVAESQKLLKPVHEGQFFVHGSHDAGNIPSGVIALQIDAGQAFGTGSHETTSACLRLINDLQNKITPSTMLDLGTGTGVLALAAQAIWPAMRTLATDIDPIAIEVTNLNIDVNNAIIRTAGSDTAGIASLVADGMDADDIKADGPFDLITANILAGPLVDLAPDICAHLAPKGHLILSGLLITQKKEVLDAYLARGLVNTGSIEKGEWSALLLQAP